MTELGPQLEHEGSRVELGPGALERFEDRLRRRRRIRKAGVYVVVLFVCVIGAASVVLTLDRKTEPRPATSPSPSTVTSSSVLTPGTYWTPPLTRHQLIATLRANGFGTTLEVHHFFKDLGRFSHTVRFGIQVQTNGLLTQMQQLDHGPSEVAWSGAYRATGPHEVAMFGYGCTITYDITPRAGQIVIRVLDEQGPSYKGICGQRDLVAQTVVYDTEGFYRQG